MFAKSFLLGIALVVPFAGWLIFQIAYGVVKDTKNSRRNKKTGNGGAL